MKKKIIIILIIIALIILGAYLYINFYYYAPSIASPYEPCDFDRDMDCDNDDLNKFMKSYESCMGDNNFNSLADFDGSGCVTIDDKNYLFPK